MLVVSIPISKYIENSKKETYNSFEEELETSANNMMIDCMIDNEEWCTIPRYGNSLKVTYNELLVKGYTDAIKDPEGDGYCDRSYVIVENKETNGVNLEYKTCLLCDRYKTDEEWCVYNDLSCELEVSGTEGTGGWYKSKVNINLKYNDPNIIETGITTMFTDKNYNGLTNYKLENNGITTIFGFVKDSIGNEGVCYKQVKIDATMPEGKIYMGYEIYPKENSTTENNKITINDLGKYGVISGIILEFTDNVTTSVEGDILYNELSVKTKGSILTGRNNAVFQITPGIYDNITVDLENTEIKNLISKIRILKNENETSVYTNKDIAIYVEATDSVTGIAGYSYDSGVNYEESNIKVFNENKEGSVIIKDNDGNISDEYEYKINKLDKVAPTLEIDYSISEGSSGYYISKISYVLNKPKENVKSVEYVEKNTSSLPTSSDSKTDIKDLTSKTYTDSTSDKFVFLRVIDKSGNVSNWYSSNLYIGGNLSITSYDQVKTTSGNTYSLTVKKCTNDTCDSMEDITVTSNAFSVSTKGSGFYQIGISHESNSELNDSLTSLNKVVYLHNFTSSSTKARSTSVDLSRVTTIKKTFSDSNTTTKTANISDSKLNLSVSGNNYTGGSAIYSCPNGGTRSGTTCTGSSYTVSGGNTWTCNSDGKWSGSWGAASCKTGYTKGSATCSGAPSSGCTPGQTYKESCTAPCTWNGNYAATYEGTSTRYYRYTVGVIVE